MGELSEMKTMESTGRFMRKLKCVMRILIMEPLWIDGRERGSLMSMRTMAGSEGSSAGAWIGFNWTNKLNIIIVSQ